jgi:hypothetical protein
MAFLDNSGDIILDAVLTDTGRARLAAGDGSFRIVKYAFADDEIDYSKYDTTESNSNLYDLEILKTPVFEAFTNNTSTMKSKLVSIARNNLLYMPITRINEFKTGGGTAMNSSTAQASGSFVVSVDETTDDYFNGTVTEANRDGLFFGILNNGGRVIKIDQGLNTTEISKNQALAPNLVETHFIVEMDNRLGRLVAPGGGLQSYSFLDDDNIASYNITNTGRSGGFFATLNQNSVSPIAGPRGLSFRFNIKASLELQTSNFLFTKIGSTGTAWDGAAGKTFSIIDSFIRVVGATTGYKLNVPIRYIKLES